MLICYDSYLLGENWWEILLIIARYYIFVFSCNCLLRLFFCCRLDCAEKKQAEEAKEADRKTAREAAECSALPAGIAVVASEVHQSGASSGFVNDTIQRIEIWWSKRSATSRYFSYQNLGIFLFHAHGCIPCVSWFICYNSSFLTSNWSALSDEWWLILVDATCCCSQRQLTCVFTCIIQSNVFSLAKLNLIWSLLLSTSHDGFFFYPSTCIFLCPHFVLRVLLK